MVLVCNSLNLLAVSTFMRNGWHLIVFMLKPVMSFSKSVVEESTYQA